MAKIASGVVRLLDTATAPAEGETYVVQALARTFQCVMQSPGDAMVAIMVSNNGIDFLQLGTISVPSLDRACDGFTSNAPWRYVRADLVALDGDGPVTVFMGV